MPTQGELVRYDQPVAASATDILLTVIEYFGDLFGGVSDKITAAFNKMRRKRR
jgi:hypothetical protein